MKFKSNAIFDGTLTANSEAKIRDIQGPLVANLGVISALNGTASQYVRGDGTLATIPTTGGAGSAVYYYLNGSVNANVATYKQMSNTAVIGGGTDFTLTSNGLIAQFLTDAGNPNRTLIPGGAWNLEMYFSVSSAGGNQKFYIDLFKYDGTTFTLIASGSTNPEEITGGITTDLYITSIAVPDTALLVTDRLAVRVYIVDNAGGRTITLHTEDNNLCQIITTFAAGVSSLNGLSANTQYLAVGTAGTDFNIVSSIDTHTFNIPSSSASNRGLLTASDWTTFNNKASTAQLANYLPLTGGILTGALTGTSATFSGNITTSAAGSSFASPRTVGITGINTNLAARFEFGSPLNSWQVGFASRMSMQSYWGIEIYGGRQSGTTFGFNTGLNTDASLIVGGSVAANTVLVVTGAASQSGNLQSWVNSSNSVLASISSTGALSGTSATFSGIVSANTLSFTNGTNTGNIKFGGLDATSYAFDLVYQTNTALRFGVSGGDGPQFQGWGGTAPAFAGQMYFDYGSFTRNIAGRAIYFRSMSTGTAATVLTLNANGSATFASTISASNLSGTNTGDQTLASLGGVPTTRTLTINGITYDLSADRSWTISAASVSSRTIQRFVATAGQTSFTITGGYTVGLVDVYRNGVKLDNATDITAANGTTIVLTDAAALNDIIEVYKFGSEFLANNALRQVTAFTATAGQTSFSVTYSVNLVDVYYNGSKLSTSEFTATNGTSIVLATAAQLNDIIEVIAYSYTVNAFTGVSGSGTANYIAKWTASGVLNNSSIQDTGSLITLGSALQGTSATFSLAQNASTVVSVTNSDNTNANSRAIYRTISGTVTSAFLSISTLGTYIGSETSHNLNLITGGSTRLVLDASTGAATFSNKVQINAPTGTAGSGAIALSIRDVSNQAYGFDFNLEGVATGDLYLMRTNNNVQSTVLQIARSTGAATFSSSVTATSSSFPIDIYGTTNNYGLRINNVQAATLFLYSSNANAANRNWGLFTNSNVFGDFDIRQSNAINGDLTNGANSTSRLYIKNDGNVGIGTPSPFSRLHVQNSDVNTGTIALGSNLYPGLIFSSASSGEFRLDNRTSFGGFITFYPNGQGTTLGSEAMRITSGGYLKASNNGSYLYSTNPFHSFETSAADWTASVVNKSASSPNGILITYSAVSPNNNGNWMIYAQDTTALRFGVRSNGGIANFQANNSDLSDERVKKDIIPLESYWDKFKAIEIVKFKYKDQTHDDFNIGVIAQQIEKVAPEFIDTDGWGEPKLNEENEIPLKSVYTADLHHATIKVLQEAMERIEAQQVQIQELNAKIEEQQETINTLINK